MKFSLNTLRFINQHYGSAGDPAADGVDNLVEKIGAQLGAVEEVAEFGERFEGVLIVRVVACEKHPDADRLHVCKVDDGGRAQNVERDENGHVQVVCGAPNVRAGMLAAWLPPGSIVPSTFGKDPFVLEARALRGVVSNGMLASPKELTIGESHDGILEIDDPEVAPGASFADAFNLRNDAIIDIENKMFTHRPDCFGWLGVARETEGIHQRPYKSPEWYRLDPDFPQPEADDLPLEVRSEIPQLVPRFLAIALRDVEVKPSPVWLQVELAKVGIRPINNIVDYTNYFMLLTGQPLHAYDYDKVRVLSESGRAVIVARQAKEGEKLELLNGKEVSPGQETIVIATDKQAIGIGGVMGGASTEVDENTRNIIIECANFDMYSIRRTSMALGLFTDAVTRFNKGQSPLQNKAVLAKIVNEIRQFAGGKVASQLIDINHLPDDVRERGSVHPPVIVSRGFINERLGLDLSAEEMRRLLENVEFEVLLEDDKMTVKAPFWRTDIQIPEDVVEEVGRLYGFDKLPLELPRRELSPAPKNPQLQLKAEIRDHLCKLGANEILSYSFVHGDLLAKAGQSSDLAFRIANALSPDLQYYRLSLTPGLLDKVHANVKAGYGQFGIFELGKTHNKQEQDEENLPREANALAFVFAADGKSARAYSGAPHYQARKYLDGLLDRFGAQNLINFEPLASADLSGSSWLEQLAAPYEPGRSAVLRDASGAAWGVVGEFRQSVRRSLKLPDFAAGFELDPLLFSKGAGKAYEQLPKYPAVEQDICLKVASELSYAELFGFVRDTLGGSRPDDARFTLAPVDIYQREDDKAHKQITLRLKVASFKRTLTDQEVNSLLDKVAQAAAEKFAAERV